MDTDGGECEEHLDDGRLRFSWEDDPGYFSEEPDEEVDEDDYLFDDAADDEDDADDGDGGDDDADDDDDEYGGVYGVGGFGGDDYDRKFWKMYGPAIDAKIRERERLMKAVFKPPSIRAPNLRFLFFPTRKACNAPTLAALQQDYPALALYCVVDRSFYWERKGVPLSNGPLEHVRRAKSGVWDEEEGEKRPKKVREKMHTRAWRESDSYVRSRFTLFRAGQERLMKAVFKPPSIRAPNLRFLFFPTRKACNAPTLAALRQDYPALALYCVVDRSFYWERKGKTVSNAPLEHVRRAKSGVWDEEVWEMRAKNLREKMHSVNWKLVEGYCAGEDQVYVLQYQ
ncbi:unnamed protein product [Closterium sp. Yama58-4]|nr:unnamed protein product [Closterium sp. Yama58-4]